MTHYPAKLLMFGEYSIIYGSKALAIPLPLYYGSWIMDPDQNKAHYSLFPVFQYLVKSGIKSLNLSQFKSDLESGLSFKSGIPVGYGIGSSGALCAAILDRYKTLEVAEWNNYEIQKELAIIESCFHGKSSGLDPLVSYLNMQVLIEGFNGIQVLRESIKPDNIYVYLLDSGIPRKTDGLVNAFTTKCMNPNYLKGLEDEYIPLVNSCIESWVHEDQSIYRDIVSLSRLQFSYFEAYIPPKIKSIWEMSCDSEEVSIKLCGAGGGGFFLLFSQNDLESYKGNRLIKVF